jgi:glycosyltransferase involved in cell wall biosynthesis
MPAKSGRGTLAIVKLPLSIVYITLNAERCLAESLQSIATIADDVVIVDSGSSDRTSQIALEHGVRFFEQSWLGFGRQKQCAVERAMHDWVLILDADEVLTREGAEAVAEALRAEHLPAGFSLPRRNFFHGKEIRFGDWAGDRVLRLVDRRVGRFSDDEVHEKWVTAGEVLRLKQGILHYPFADYGAMLNKLARYSDLGARKLGQRSVSPSAAAPVTHGLYAFVRCYFFRLGVFDGADGFGIALITALGSFLKYAKAREIASDAVVRGEPGGT